MIETLIHGNHLFFLLRSSRSLAETTVFSAPDSNRTRGCVCYKTTHRVIFNFSRRMTSLVPSSRLPHSRPTGLRVSDAVSSVLAPRFVACSWDSGGRTFGSDSRRRGGGQIHKA